MTHGGHKFIIDIGYASYYNRIMALVWAIMYNFVLVFDL